MAMRMSRTPANLGAAPEGTADRQNLARLEALGIKVDPETGKATAVEGAFQGTADPTLDPDALGSGVQVLDPEQIVTLDPNAPLVEDEPALPADPAAEPEPEPARKPGDQTEEGLAKREKDAREAQAAMGKAQAKLDKTLRDVNTKLADLDTKIERLAALQTTTGRIPEGMDPADAATVAEWRRDSPEAMQVIDALVAPAFAQISALNDRVTAVVQRIGEFLSEAKTNEVFGAVYEKIPKAKVDQITNSPEFIAWLGELPKSISQLYVDVLENTSNHEPAEALRIFREYSRDSGIDIGLDQVSAPQAPPPPMDTVPALRSGGALPPSTPPRRPQPTALTPLTNAEALRFSQLMDACRTQAERDTLTQRLRLRTDFNFDGDAVYAQER